MTEARPSMVLRGVGVHADRVVLQGSRSAKLPVQDGVQKALSSDVSLGSAVVLTRTDSVEPSFDGQMLQALHQQARRQGFEEGLRDGLAAAREQVEAELAEQRSLYENTTQEAVVKLEREKTLATVELANRFDAVCSGLHQQLASYLQQLEQQAVALAFQSIQTILGADSQRVGALRTLIEQQVSALRDTGALRIHLNPDDFCLFEQGEETSLPDKSVQVAIDTRLPRGGCVIHSRAGRLDVGLPSQLARLGQIWCEVVERAVDERNASQSASCSSLNLMSDTKTS